VAELVYAMAAISRLAANRKTSPQQFRDWLSQVVHAEDERTIQSRVCILLSLAAELFAFYVALFDLAFSESDSH